MSREARDLPRETLAKRVHICRITEEGPESDNSDGFVVSKLQAYEPAGQAERPFLDTYTGLWVSVVSGVGFCRRFGLRSKTLSTTWDGLDTGQKQQQPINSSRIAVATVVL